MESKKKTVWFVAHYTMPPEYEIRVKTLRFAEYLKEFGYNTLIFTASTIHNTNINLIKSNKKYIKRKYGNLDYVHIRCHDYNSSMVKRIVNMYEFAFKFSKIVESFDKPDIVVLSANCINYKLLFKYFKKQNIPVIIDVRDLWPLSFVEYLGFSGKNPVIKYFYNREKEMYKMADAIVFSLEGWKEYFRDRKLLKKIKSSKVRYINNGVDYHEFVDLASKVVYSDTDFEKDNEYKIVYTGSVRLANNLEKLVMAMKYLDQVNTKNIVLYIFGDGGYRSELEDICKNNGINNVKFKGFVEKKYIPNILKRANLTVISLINSRLFKYGFSPNKIFDYLAAEKPILMTSDINYNFIVQNGCGLVINDETPEKMAMDIKAVVNMPDEQFKQMSINCRELAKKFDYRELTKKLEEIIIEMLQNIEVKDEK